MAFEFSNYSNTYTAKGTIGNIYRTDAACFSDVFRSLVTRKDYDIVYTITINKNKDLVLHNKNNYCFLTKQELHNHIRILKKLFDFSYSIKETEESYIVSAHLYGNSVTHKYFLTWVRYSYEYPYNVMCLDALNLYKQPEFKFVSKINIFSLFSQVGFNYEPCHCFVQQGSSQFNLLKNKELAQILNSNCSGVQDIFRQNKRKCSGYTVYKIGDTDSVDRNELELSFKDRLSIYMKLYNHYYEDLRCRR